MFQRTRGRGSCPLQGRVYGVVGRDGRLTAASNKVCLECVSRWVFDELMVLNLDDYANATERLWCVSG